MDNLNEDIMCRICFKKQDTVFSLFCKRKGESPCEKLNKIGVKVDVNDAGPSCICCNCLNELETTVNFLEKCEKSTRILAERLGDIFKDSTCLHSENTKVDNIKQECQNATKQECQNTTKQECQNTTKQESKSVEELSVDEACCEVCGSHRRCQHWAPSATHTCPTCHKVFNRKFNFKLHLKRHSDEGEWWCEKCGASAVSRWLAARHCRPRARRTCPVPGCGKTYTSSTNLSVHVRKHNGERPFECNDCGKKYSSKNTLQIHMRIHTGALPYICPICGKQFRTNKLSVHMLTHSDETFSCKKPGCDRLFSSPAALRRHLRAHPPAPPPPRDAPTYACALCSSRYLHKQSLNKHVKKQHAQLPAPAAQVEPDQITKETEGNPEQPSIKT